jgi:hypothetical protein
VVIGGFMPMPILERLAVRLEPLQLSVSTTAERSLPRVVIGAAGKDSSVLGAAALPIFSETNPRFEVLQKPVV